MNTRSLPQIYLTWTYDPNLRMQESNDLGPQFGPQPDPEWGAEFMNSLSEEFMSSLSAEDLRALRALSQL